MFHFIRFGHQLAISNDGYLVLLYHGSVMYHAPYMSLNASRGHWEVKKILESDLSQS